MARLVALESLQQFAAVNLLSDPGHIPGPVVIPSCAQLRMHWGLEDGKTAFNVMYVRYPSAFPINQTMLNTIKTALTTGAQWTALAAFIPTTQQFGALSSKDVNTPNNAYIGSNTAGVFGTSASPALPNEVAVVGTIRTAFTGQSNRGRIYIPGWATNSLGAGNVVAAAAVTALNNWLATILTAVAAQGLTLVLGQPARAQYTSPTTGRVHPARPAQSQTVTQIIVRDNTWDTQRRRGLK